MLAIAVIFGTWSAPALGQITIRGISSSYTPEETAAIQRAVNYWNDVINFSSPNVTPAQRNVYFDKDPEMEPGSGQGGWSDEYGPEDEEEYGGFVVISGNPASNWDNRQNTQLKLGTNNLESLMIHELGHVLGILSIGFEVNEDGTEVEVDEIAPGTWGSFLYAPNGQPLSGWAGQTLDINPGDQFTFRGPNAISVFGDHVPVFSEAGEGSALAHPDTPFGNMNAFYDANSRPFFSEVELAIMQDLGHNITRSRFFGHSVYLSDQTLTNTIGFNGNGMFGIGLHVVGNDNTITQTGNLIATGYAGAGMRIEGTGNSVTNQAIISANGDGGTGVLITHGNNATFTNNGTISARRSLTNGLLNAIYVNSSDNTINLNNGSSTVGHIRQGAGSNNTLNLQSGVTLGGGIDSTFDQINFDATNNEMRIGGFVWLTRDFGWESVTIGGADSLVGNNTLTLFGDGRNLALDLAARNYDTPGLEFSAFSHLDVQGGTVSGGGTSLWSGGSFHADTINNVGVIRDLGLVYIGNTVTGNGSFINIGRLSVQNREAFDDIRRNAVISGLGILNVRDNLTLSTGENIDSAELGGIGALWVDGNVDNSASISGLNSTTLAEPFPDANTPNFLVRGSLTNQLTGTILDIDRIHVDSGFINVGTVNRVDTIYIGGELSHSGSISNVGEISMGTYNSNNTGAYANVGTMEIRSGLTLNEGRTIDNVGTLSVWESVNNRGTIAVNDRLDVGGRLANTGSITGTPSAEMRIEENILNEGGTISNFGLIQGGEIRNTAIYNAAGDVIQGGVIENIGSIEAADREVSGSGDWNLITNPDGTQTAVMSPGNGEYTLGMTYYTPGRGDWTEVIDPVSGTWILLYTPGYGDWDITWVPVGSENYMLASNFINSTGSVVRNVADTLSAHTLRNDGLIENVGTIELQGNFLNREDAVTVGVGGISADTLSNAGILALVGTIDVHGDFRNREGAIAIGIDSISAASITNDGDIVDVGTIYMPGNFQNRRGALVLGVDSISAENVTNHGEMSGIGFLSIRNDFLNVGSGERDADGVLHYTGGLVSYVDELEAESIRNRGGRIFNVGNMTTDTLRNENITMGGYQGQIEEIDNLEAGSVLNSAVMRSIGTMNVAGNLDNFTGDIHEVESMTVGGDVYSTGRISNVGTMSIAGNLTSTVSLVDVGTLTVGNSIANSGSMINVKSINAPVFGNTGLLAGTTRLAMNGGTFMNDGGVIVVGDTGIDADGVPYLAGIGTLAIDGNFVSSGGAFVIGINDDPTETLKNSLIEVSGSAFITGGTLQIAVEDGKFYPATTSEDRYVFLTAAEGLYATGMSAGSINDPLLKATVRSDDSEAWFFIERKFLYAGEGNTKNQRAMGRYIDAVGIYPDSDYREVLLALDKAHMYTEAQVSGAQTTRAERIVPMGEMVTVSDPLQVALDQMSGSIYATMTTASFQNTVMLHNTLANVLRRDYNAVAAVYDQAGYRGQSSARDLKMDRGKYKSTNNLWGMIYGHAGTMFDDGSVGKYRQGFSGIMAGYDRVDDRKCRLGVFLSMGEGSLSGEIRDRSLTQEFMAGHYFRRDTEDGYILLQAGLGNHRYNTRRHIAFGGPDLTADPNDPNPPWNTVNRTARNTHNAFLATAHVETGMRYRGGIFNFSPFAGAQYTGLVREGFTERGADSINLTTGMEDYHSLRAMFGLRFDSEVFRFKGGLTSFYGNVAWMYEFDTGERHTRFDARFTNAGFPATASKFTVYGNDPGRDWIQTGFGINHDIHAHLRAFLGYDAYANDRQVMHACNLGFVWER
ncbi:MAG: autotransporter domain-containing protein [Planctomycetaceae bacterium]|nr:autotransporter domain-containing protein [Planctomycetaceae bacterium]